MKGNPEYVILFSKLKNSVRGGHCDCTSRAPQGLVTLLVVTRNSMDNAQTQINFICLFFALATGGSASVRLVGNLIDSCWNKCSVLPY